MPREIRYFIYRVAVTRRSERTNCPTPGPSRKGNHDNPVCGPCSLSVYRQSSTPRTASTKRVVDLIKRMPLEGSHRKDQMRRGRVDTGQVHMNDLSSPSPSPVRLSPACRMDRV